MRHFYLTAVIVTVAVMQSITVAAQKGKPIKANDLLSSGDFEAALDEYLLLVEDDPSNAKWNYRVGVCYLNSNIDKSQAISYLEKCVNHEKLDINSYYLLGRAYHFGGRFDDAIKWFEKYKAAGGGTAASTAEVDKQVEYCENAKELIKYPLDITFENLGSNVNSVYPDYYPFIPTDESFIAYNSKREDGSTTMANGQYGANVYMATVENGEYAKARPIRANINTKDGNEEIIGMNANGNIILLYYDNFDVYGDILIANKKTTYYQAPVLLDETINSPNNHEISASISSDGNTLYFASDRRGGLGGTDIYMSKKLPIGGWGPPQNLGPTVNTEFDEDFPNISPDSKILYFSSKGHTSMGGYDIFKAEWDPQNNGFKNVRNMGYPLNTTNDDMNFRVSQTGRHGYIAAVRKEGLGDFDIYRVTFNNVDPKYSVLKGVISSKDTSKTVVDVFITVTKKETGDVFGEYTPNVSTKRYIIALPPGEYNIFYDSASHKAKSEDVKILGKTSFQAEINKDILLDLK